MPLPPGSPCRSKRTRLVLAAALVLACGWVGRPAHAESVVTIGHNANGSTSDDFKFEKAAGPRRSAALAATFTLLDGTPDPGGGTLDAFHDGVLPSGEDEPAGNFFFATGSNGGRILVDLGKVIQVQEVDSYSWHPAGRGPQVYKLYGSDGSGPAFVPGPKRPQDPTACGWKLIASVDTRPRSGEAGGQYAVNITGAAGGDLGACRYLLFDAISNDASDSFGNTFYSEIVIVDRNAPAPSGAGAALAKPFKESSTFDQKGYQLVFDSDDATFDPKVKARMVSTFFTIYPQLADFFNKNSPRKVRISIETRYQGVAATAANTIHVNPAWFHQHPTDIDVITHEAMHVVQQYKQWGPSWVVEGIADYARYKFGVDNPGAGWTLPNYTADQNYDNSYRVTARFFAWLEKKVKPGIVQMIDQSMRTGTYTPATWKELTGRDVGQLWQDYGKDPAL